MVLLFDFGLGVLAKLAKAEKGNQSSFIKHLDGLGSGKDIVKIEVKNFFHFSNKRSSKNNEQISTLNNGTPIKYLLFH